MSTCKKCAKEFMSKAELVEHNKKPCDYVEAKAQPKPRAKAKAKAE